LVGREKYAPAAPGSPGEAKRRGDQVRTSDVVAPRALGSKRAELDLGADPNVRNAKGRTPLTMATSARFEATIALLSAAAAH
jgi:ankyrin repeat protein